MAFQAGLTILRFDVEAAFHRLAVAGAVGIGAAEHFGDFVGQGVEFALFFVRQLGRAVGLGFVFFRRPFGLGGGGGGSLQTRAEEIETLLLEKLERWEMLEAKQNGEGF